MELAYRVSILNNCMSTHIPERDIHEKILTSHPFPNSVKETPILDEYTEKHPGESGINSRPTDKTFKHHGSRARDSPRG